MDHRRQVLFGMSQRKLTSMLRSIVLLIGTFTLAVVAGLKVQERYLIAQAIDGAALFASS